MTDKVNTRLAMWAGIGYERELRAYLEQLGTVSRVMDYAGGAKPKELDPTRPDFKVWLTDGSVVFVDAKLDPNSRGTVSVSHKQYKGYLKHAEDNKAYLFLGAGAPEYPGFFAVSPAVISDFMKTASIQFQGGTGLAIAYTAEWSFEQMFSAIVERSMRDGAA